MELGGRTLSLDVNALSSSFWDITHRVCERHREIDASVLEEHYDEELKFVKLVKLLLVNIHSCL